jgi:hypothetical protein
MSPNADKILEEARQLTPAERDWLIENLIAEQGPMSDETFAVWQKNVGEPEPGYNEWFRKGVGEALADPSPDISHEQVAKEIGGILEAARERKRLKQSA